MDVGLLPVWGHCKKYAMNVPLHTSTGACLQKPLGVGFLGYLVRVCSTLEASAILISKAAVPFRILTNSVWELQFAPHSPQHAILSAF